MPFGFPVGLFADVPCGDGTGRAGAVHSLPAMQQDRFVTGIEDVNQFGQLVEWHGLVGADLHKMQFDAKFIGNRDLFSSHIRFRTAKVDYCFDMILVDPVPKLLFTGLSGSVHRIVYDFPKIGADVELIIQQQPCDNDDREDSVVDTLADYGFRLFGFFCHGGMVPNELAAINWNCGKKLLQLPT